MMSFLRKAARAVGSAIGKTLLYTGVAVSAFSVAVGATPQRNDSAEVVHMLATSDTGRRSGSITVPPPEDTSRSGSIEWKPWEVIPCWFGCSGSLTVSGSELAPDEPDIPTASLPTASLHGLLEEETQTYDPDEDIDDSDFPNALNTIVTGDMSRFMDAFEIKIVSISDPVSVGLDYRAAVPQTRLIMNQPEFLILAQSELGLPDFFFNVFASALPSNAIPSNILARDTFLHFVPLVNGAIPSNANPSNAIPSNLRISEAIPSNAIPSNYHRAIPSNSWGLLYAIPSNMTPSELEALGADPSKIPAEIPLNLTVADLRRYGIPSNAIPSNAIPSNAIPSNAIPSNAIPSNLVVLDLLQSLIYLPAIGTEVGLRPQPILINQLEYELGVERISLAGRVKAMGCDGSCTSSGRIVADAEAVDAGYDLTSIVSELSGAGILEVFRPGSNRVQLAYDVGYETIQLPYRTGIEQAPGVGVETIAIGPQLGVDFIRIGPTQYWCTEDLTGVSAWLGHKYSGNFTVQYILASGESYQSSMYELSIDNQLQADCQFDVENPRVLHCIRDGIASERWADLVLRSMPSNCEVWGGTYYVCPAGETYHAPNPWWDGTYGLCCTTACWCTLPGGETGCFNNCPGCPP